MPISPTVNAYMAQDQQPPMTSEDMFKSAFQDHAFNALRAKASNILPYTVTFKVFDVDVDNGNAFGSFAVSYGNELVYSPVVMTGGSVTSCEMVYLREEDRFVPLQDKYIEDIVNKNNSVTGRVMEKDVRVEDTRNMFRNIVRPPASSNVVLAGARMDISELPNHAKAQVAEYLSNNPELMRKIGEYYPVRALGEKLAATEPEKAKTETKPVRKLEDMPAQEVAHLPAKDKKNLKERGWIAEDTPETVETFGGELENRFEEHPTSWHDKKVYYAEVLCNTGLVFTIKSVLIIGDQLISKEGARYDAGKNIVTQVYRPANKADLSIFGFVKANGIHSNKKSGRVLILVPMKAGSWECADKPYAYNNEFSCVKLDNGDYRITTGNTKPFFVTSAIKFGAVDTALSENALFKFIENNTPQTANLVTSMQALFDLIRSRGITLKVKRSGVGIDITNTKTQRTKSFNTEGKAAAYLNDEFNMSERQILGTLNRPKTFVITKFAADMMQPQPMPAAPAQPMQQPQPQPQPQIMPQGNTTVPAQPFNPSAINTFATMQDPEMLDAGILTSFAGDPDVKALLVDYLPDFINIMDRIGRVILLFNVKRKELEQYYRVDRINELLQNCRKIFKMVGSLVPDLQLYINMA